MKEKIIERIYLIKNEIDQFQKSSKNISLLSGISGIPIFNLLFYRLTENIGLKKEIDFLLLKIIDVINENEINCNYSNGLIGIAKMFDFVLKSNISDVKLKNDIAKVLFQFDKIILRESIQNTKTVNDIDYLHGTFGAALYLIDRITNETENNFKIKVIKLFEVLADIVIKDIKDSLLVENLDLLYDSAHRTNCGLAHGYVSHILIFLKFLKFFPQNKKVNIAFKESISHLLRFENESDSKISKFPSIAVNKKTAEYDIALGWCYGDQTISFCLYKASLVLQDVNLMNKSIKLAYRNLERSRNNRSFPYQNFDAGFCHGLSSIAYLHKKWYLFTNDKLFLTEYQRLLCEILNFGNKYNGFPKFNGDKGYQNTIGLLDGSIGVGVVLLDSLLTNQIDHWESFFLLDI
jgi:hypothetical protein